MSVNGIRVSDPTRALATIAGCDDADRLRVMIRNAQKQDQKEVADAAFRRLISIVPSEEPGTLEHDFWQTIHAFEYVLSEERGKTTLLSRTRQKVSRVGVHITLRDWALKPTKTEGFKMLLERGMAELTGEAIVVRHADAFDVAVVDSAKRRLREACVARADVEA